MKTQAERLARLAKETPTLAEFIKEALRWPRRYGFPGVGSMADYKSFYAKHGTKANDVKPRHTVWK